MRHVHFIGIAGTGMGSLAGLLRRRGLEVTGSDAGVYPPMRTALEAWGIPVHEGFRPEHVLARRPDLVVIGNVIRSENPEARAARESGLPCMSFPEALYAHAIHGRHSIVVAGTHGKTTTTSLIATLLVEAGRDPSMLVGGIAANFDASFREGAGPDFVVEGDEYDTAFFDKSPKFVHYHADTAVLTSIEFDHADIYRDLAHVEEAFEKLVAQLPPEGTLVAALAHETVARVAGRARCRVVGYAASRDAPVHLAAGAVHATPEGTRFELLADGVPAGSAFLRLHGHIHVENALAALAVLEARGVPLERAAELLPRYRGVRRRQEVRGEARGVTVIDDFAHHPTAVRETLQAMRARYPGRRLLAVFEPRSNTSRRAVFQRDYALALARADAVVVQVVADAPIYSATGEVRERLSAERLAADVAAAGVPALALPDVPAIVEHLASSCRPGDVVVAMSNGSFGGIWDALLARLGEAGPPGPGAQPGPAA
jgi:UDP-N-acetylmuramate: L-alanyl-gamma-D-glutamyl-meso-diaminopimelate ligase